MACVNRKECDGNLACSCVLGSIFPPAGMLCRYGCSHQVAIAAGLTCLGYIPGVIYAGYELGFVPDSEDDAPPPPPAKPAPQEKRKWSFWRKESKDQ
mmetsp:Transcript_50918/g.142495  ORF Transcript_50918/g.142495 Transcript_50918/m.142495 type:complete len:97 (+) Transcript_50918:111-401(+)